MSDLQTKIILGTVQFGLNYGINNHVGQVSSKEIDSILSLAHSCQINCLDTSYAYGESEAVLFDSFSRNPLEFNIVSKYPQIDGSVQSVFDESLKRLGKDKIYGYLVHHFDSFKLNPEIWNDFIVLKNQGKVLKVGFSIYSTEQLLYLFDNNVTFDLIQFPYNLFDRQFEPYFSELKNRNVEIHTRSVFLQGLFFKELNTFDGKLEVLKPYLVDLHQYCNSSNISISQLALNFVLQNKFIDGVLMGVDSVEQLTNNLKDINFQLDSTAIEFVNKIIVKEKELLNPVNWK